MAADDEPQPAQPVDRDAAGRFAVGNQAARNRRAALHRRAVAAALADEGDPSKVAEVLSGLRVAAAAGDIKAAELWLANVVGRPRERQLAVDDVELPAVESRAQLGAAFATVARLAGSGELGLDEARELAKLLADGANILAASGDDGPETTEAIRSVVREIVARRAAAPDELVQQQRLRQFLVAASDAIEGDPSATAENADHAPEPSEGATP